MMRSFLPLMLSISVRIFSVVRQHVGVPQRHKSQRDRQRYRPLPLLYL